MGLLSSRRRDRKSHDEAQRAINPAREALAVGYKDVVNTEHTGLAGGPIQIAAKPDLSGLTDDELKQLRAIADKTLPPGRN
jgi:hypothetical protein